MTHTEREHKVLQAGYGSLLQQFEIEELARKLFTFWTPKGLYWYKRLVMTNNPVSLECHRRVQGRGPD